MYSQNKERIPSARFPVLVLIICLPGWAQIPFDHVVVDKHGPRDPWAKIIADIDGNGFDDIVIGGRDGPLVWYAYPNWKKTVIAQGGYKTVDGEAGDVDRDGDLDIVMGGLIWYENPRLGGDVYQKNWKAHKVADHPTHDIELGDLDRDGRLDIVTRDQSEFGHKTGNKIYLWCQGKGNKWTQKVINCPHGEGLELADIDRDGDLDIVIGGIWFENSGEIVADPWNAHSFCQWHANATVQVKDINADGRPDVILSPSELKGSFYRISWFKAPADPRVPVWQENIIAEHVECVIHGLAAADMNGDGIVDVVSAEMHQGADPDEVVVYINQQKGLSWKMQVVSTKGSHYIQAADIGADGDFDLVGANWSGSYQPIEMWLNRLSDRSDSPPR
jgi:hypothetical protein